MQARCVPRFIQRFPKKIKGAADCTGKYGRLLFVGITHAREAASPPQPLRSASAAARARTTSGRSGMEKAHGIALGKR